MSLNSIGVLEYGRCGIDSASKRELYLLSNLYHYRVRRALLYIYTEPSLPVDNPLPPQGPPPLLSLTVISLKSSIFSEKLELALPYIWLYGLVMCFSLTTFLFGLVAGMQSLTRSFVVFSPFRRGRDLSINDAMPETSCLDETVRQNCISGVGGPSWGLSLRISSTLCAV